MEGIALEDRTAVVTGGAGGIGSAIVRDLASLGAKVAVCDIDQEGAAKVAADVDGARPFGVDLSDPASVDALIGALGEQIGRVDVLVNNAGWDSVGPFLESDPGVWDRLFAINLRAPIHLTHGLARGMAERGWGRLVYVSSDAARVGSSGEGVYSACKAGLVGFAKTMARELARAGVTSNVVCPGPSDTRLLHDIADDNPKLVEGLKRSIPLGRLAQPADVAGMVAYLSSERASYMTGQTVSVSGGLTMA